MSETIARAAIEAVDAADLTLPATGVCGAPPVGATSLFAALSTAPMVDRLPPHRLVALPMLRMAPACVLVGTITSRTCTHNLAHGPMAEGCLRALARGVLATTLQNAMIVSSGGDRSITSSHDGACPRGCSSAARPMMALIRDTTGCPA